MNQVEWNCCANHANFVQLRIHIAIFTSKLVCHSILCQVGIKIVILHSTFTWMKTRDSIRAIFIDRHISIPLLSRFKMVSLTWINENRWRLELVRFKNVCSILTSNFSIVEFIKYLTKRKPFTCNVEQVYHIIASTPGFDAKFVYSFNINVDNIMDFFSLNISPFYVKHGRTGDAWVLFSECIHSCSFVIFSDRFDVLSRVFTAVFGNFQSKNSNRA